MKEFSVTMQRNHKVQLGKGSGGSDDITGEIAQSITSQAI